MRNLLSTLVIVLAVTCSVNSNAYSFRELVRTVADKTIEVAATVEEKLDTLEEKCEAIDTLAPETSKELVAKCAKFSEEARSRANNAESKAEAAQIVVE